MLVSDRLGTLTRHARPSPISLPDRLYEQTYRRRLAENDGIVSVADPMATQ